MRGSVFTRDWVADRMTGEFPIHDNHFHCRPDGWKGARAVREFMAAGGTSVTHVRLPSYPSSVEAFAQSSRDHVAFGRELARATGCTVWSAVGPYPLEIMKVAEAKGWPTAREFGRACYAEAAQACMSGGASCIGEVGRAHFGVAPEVQGELNGLLEEGMRAAHEAGVPVMLHTEHATSETMGEFAAMADRAGLARDRVIKHYCGPLVLQAETHGLVPSVIAGRSNLRAALAKVQQEPAALFLMETDYIDEPTRPDVVMPCDTVPKRVMGLVQNGELDARFLVRAHGDLPRRLFGAPLE